MVTIKEYMEFCEKVIEAGPETSSEMSLDLLIIHLQNQTNLIRRMSKAIDLSERALERATHFASNKGQQALLKEALDDIRELRG